MSTRGIRASYLLKPDDQIGVYRVVRPLGAGGMGEVYLVEHQHLRKRYALKILPPDISGDADFIDRFRIEARIMADMEHSGVVRVHNFGEESGRHYLVMDYVEGPDGAPRTLDDELAWGKRLPERVVLEMAIQLCDALEYAHTFAQGAVIHRDLKPGNILIQKAEKRTGSSTKNSASKATSELRIKIADFGLAKIVGTDYIRAVINRSTALTARPVRQLSPDAQVTQTDADTSAGSTMSLLGTYDYMGPEQKEGATADERSDIYALGLILYKMLTGHKPEGSYEPPSKSGVSRRWDPLIGRCLKRKPEARYQEVAKLKRDLLKLATPVHRRMSFTLYAVVAASVLTLISVHVLRRPVKEGSGESPDPAPQPVEQKKPERTSPKAEPPKPALREVRREQKQPAKVPVEPTAPPAKKGSASLTVRVETWSPMDSKYLPKAGRLRLDEGPVQEVDLPVTLAVKELSKVLKVELDVPGFTVGRKETVWMMDGEERDLVFRVFPNPVQIVIESDVPADVYRLREDKPISGMKRFVLGREMPIARTGQAFTLDPFAPYRLHVVAKGYKPEVLELFPVNPGATNETHHVTLEPGEGWE